MAHAAGAVRVVTQQSPLGALLAGPAPVLDRDATVREAAEVMRDAHVSAVLIGTGTGILTERDLARAVADGVDDAAPVTVLATPRPVTVPGTTTVLQAAARMLDLELRHLVVDMGSGGLGIVSLRDIAAVLLQEADPELWLHTLRLVVGSASSEIWLG